MQMDSEDLFTAEIIHADDSVHGFRLGYGMSASLLLIDCILPLTDFKAG